MLSIQEELTATFWDVSTMTFPFEMFPNTFLGKGKLYEFITHLTKLFHYESREALLQKLHSHFQEEMHF